MSPRNGWPPLPARVASALGRTALALGAEVRDERTRRRWTMRELALKAGVSVSMVHAIEAGEPSSLEGYHRIAAPLGLHPRFTLHADRGATSARALDPVHAAMGEVESTHLRAHGSEMRLDEPYQHYQFAGRADVVGIDAARRALLHIENRTRFPDIGGFAGSFNAKRAYLADDLVRRLGLGRGERDLRSVTHVVVALWSAEVLHVLRLRAASFRGVAPDRPDAFAAWWNGTAPPRGTSTTFVVFDPLPGIRQSRRRWIGLDEALRAEPRYRDYASALAALRGRGLA